ncbi:hypothetical protein [Massilia timonae]|uniref:Uncharacterized protein n=1 Tax=Massilia timonae TaxID=47229 RepID=A0A1S2N7C0_9BURK|nr:hypothetical protein [Massilia timonae]OIJ40773.1 hypothetical protein LO55_5061 [Massilia timonae]
MLPNQSQQMQRAHSLDLALRTPGVCNGSDVLKLAAAYQAYIIGGTPESAGAGEVSAKPVEATDKA